LLVTAEPVFDATREPSLEVVLSAAAEAATVGIVVVVVGAGAVVVVATGEGALLELIADVSVVGFDAATGATPVVVVVLGPVDAGGALVVAGAATVGFLANIIATATIPLAAGTTPTP
jgi:hypothetical protein